MTTSSIQHLTGNQPYLHAGLRVVVKWNPELNFWFVYDERYPNRPIFSTTRLELHTVGCYSGRKTKFAPDGSPNFLGTVVVESILEPESDKVTHVISHQYAPSKLFFDIGQGDLEPFDHCRRILLDGSTMIADRRINNS